MIYTDGAKNYVTIYLTQDKSPEKTLNLLLLAKGYAKLNESVFVLKNNLYKYLLIVK